MSLAVSLPLHRATIQGKYDDILKLIDNNQVEIDQQDHEGTTALILACASNQLPVASLLLQKGANPNLQRHNERKTSFAKSMKSGPLFFACQGGFLELVELLLRYNVPVAQSSCEGGCPLLVACQNGHLKTVERLLQLNDSTLLEAKLRDGANGLFLAAQNGHLATVNFLLSRGITVDACRKDGTTALYIATQMGHIDICKALINAGANVDARREDGTTSLYRAAQKGYTDIMEVLFESSYGRPSTGLLANGSSALHVTTANGDVKASLLLIREGADPTLRNKKGDSALSLAQAMRNPELIKALQDPLVKQQQRQQHQQNVSSSYSGNMAVTQNFNYNISVVESTEKIRPISMEGSTSSLSLPYGRPISTQYNSRPCDAGGSTQATTSRQSHQHFEPSTIQSQLANSQPMLNHILTREQSQYHNRPAFTGHRMMSNQQSFSTTVPSQKQFVYPQQPTPDMQLRQQQHSQLQHQMQQQQSHQMMQHRQHMYHQQHQQQSRQPIATQNLTSPLQYQRHTTQHQMFITSQTQQQQSPNFSSQLGGRNDNCVTSPTTYRNRDILGYYNGRY